MSNDEAGLSSAAIIITVELFLLVLFIAVPEVVTWLDEALEPVWRVLTWPLARMFWAAEWAFDKLAATLRRWTG